MILANKNGNLSVIHVLRKTRSGTHVQAAHSNHTFFVSNKEQSVKLCESAEEAMAHVQG
jgi:hypothetical protein